MAKNKVLVTVAVVALALILGAAVIMASINNKNSNTSNDKDDSDVSYEAVKACDLLTLDEAKQLMGEAASEGDNAGPASSEAVKVDTCSYTNNATSVPDIKIATVMVRSAMNEDGMESNKAAFEADGSANPAGAQQVDDYGDKAFWDASTHQLAILKDNQWIGIIYGGTNPANNTLEDAKKVADLVVK